MSWYNSWYSSWIPGLPSINLPLPTSIQRRFLSFVLKRSLGHLLKPGQLDVNQIETQISSGYVQVKDLELDSDAINQHLTGIPVKLCDGSIASVIARIPWPNPLTSALGLSIQSLNLVFNVVPSLAATEPQSPVDIEGSVASMAESFIHDELDPREEATLRQSFHPDLSSPSIDEQGLPGGLDPFISSPDAEESPPDMQPSGVSIFATLIERLVSRFAFDAADIRITLVYPDRTSFTLSVEEVQYRTEEQQEPTTRADAGRNVEEHRGPVRTASVSGVSITARNLSPAVLSSPTPSSPYTSSPVSSRKSTTIPPATESPPAQPISRTSSSSSLDEETQLMMSQSLVSLPPRPPSPSSVASSMYQSAVSASVEKATPTFRNIDISEEPAVSSNSSPVDGEDASIHEDLIFSIGAEPIVVRLRTSFQAVSPQPQASAPAQSPSRPQSNEGPRTDAVQGMPKLTLSVTAGVFSIALRASHIRSIVDLLDALSAAHPPPVVLDARSADANAAGFMGVIAGLGLEASLDIRGLVLLLLPRSSGAPAHTDPALVHFFDRPLVPPRLSSGYVRIFLERFSASLSLSAPSTELPEGVSRKASPLPTPVIMSSTLSLHDISVFVFHAMTAAAANTFAGTHDHEMRATPVLISDSSLLDQYTPIHVAPAAAELTSHASDKASDAIPQLPAFDVLDWTLPTPGSAKVSTWRTKPKSKIGRHAEYGSHEGQVHISTSSSPGKHKQRSDHQQGHSGRVVTVNLKQDLTGAVRERRQKNTTPSTQITVDVAPMQIFVDCGLALREEAVTFVDEILYPNVKSAQPPPLGPEGYDEDEDDLADTPPATPRLSSREERERERERERRRLEKLVLDDLDLYLDYREENSGGKTKVEPTELYKKPKKKRTPQQKPPVSITVNLAMIRMQIRCPSPPSLPPRSGAVILDAYAMSIHIPPPKASPSSTVKFSQDFDASASVQDRTDKSSGSEALISLDCSRLLMAVSLMGDVKAESVLSLGPQGSERHGTGELSDVVSGAGSSSSSSAPRLKLLISRLSPTAQRHYQRTTTSILSFDVPSAHVHLSKSAFDAVQLWADDVTQLIERTFGGGSDTDTQRADSRDPSLIGSRFFTKSRTLDSKSSEGEIGGQLGRAPETKSETVVKLSISEALLTLLLPSEPDESASRPSRIRPFNISASDIDILMEFKPEGKDETVFTVGVRDASITDVTSSNHQISLLSLTSSLSTTSTTRPLLKLRFTSLTVPETTAKESKIKLTLSGFTYNQPSDVKWISDLACFAKAPPGAFESVIPSERTKVSVKLVDGSVRAVAPSHPGSSVLYIEDLDFTTDLVGDSLETSLQLLVQSASLLFIDDLSSGPDGFSKAPKTFTVATGVPYWKEANFALVAEIFNLDMVVTKRSRGDASDTQIIARHLDFRGHLCADTMGSLSSFIQDFASIFSPPADQSAPPVKPKRAPSAISEQGTMHSMMSSLDEHAFRRIPEVGSAPDMIADDLPTNLDYLDQSFSAAAGLREMRDDDLDDFDVEDTETNEVSSTPGGFGIISNIGGETIKMIRPIKIIEDYFESLPPEAATENQHHGDTSLMVRIYDCDVTLLLYDGYDWARTRKTIEEEIKEMKKRLAKIRQLVASGQTYDPSIEETSALLFNSVYIGLEQDANSLEPGALIAAIDEELDEDFETSSQSSWQSLPPPSAKTSNRPTQRRVRRLRRSNGPCIEFRLMGINAHVDQYLPDTDLVSRTFVTIRDVEILDHIRTSTWKKFLTELQKDTKGNVRETDSNMVQVELCSVHPVPGHPSQESRLRAKILPLRLYVDQDALDFLKKFFSFNDPNTPANPTSGPSEDDVYFQHAEVFPVDIKLDYKPRRVDYRALREGRTIELMNFFHFDGAEMTLRHITLSGITGWPRLFDLLNDLWTPDVKATQLVDVISGVAPIRSAVNVGSGIADLVLLPIAQYKKDGRIIRGVQKGTTAFMKSTAMEAIKLGARLATGTQVILEQAENVLGGRFDSDVTAETLQIPAIPQDIDFGNEEEARELISKYAEQPENIREGVTSAYKSLQRNFSSAAQTILAVPMEVYEKSGSEGPVRSVIRAVPIAVLKPMIGASEAVSKTLMGLHNTLDPSVRQENEAKYKQR